MKITYCYRVKDKHASRLTAQSRAVNFVWNYCNEVQQKAFRDHHKWLTGYDLCNLVAGCTKEGLDLHSHSALRVCLKYESCRRQHKKAWLRWRSKRSLGWVPFNTDTVKFRDGGFVFRGQRYDVWLHRPLPAGVKIGAGSFHQDTIGRWYINCPVEIAESNKAPLKYVGIDLGLKTLATLSSGDKIEMPRFFRKSEAKIAAVQRAKKIRRVRALQAKVANRRMDFLHKASAQLAKEYGLIVIGNVSASKLAQTDLAKSVLDAGWSGFKSMLSYKLRLRSGGMLLEVSEHLTTQTCSECGSLPPSRPSGNAGLSKRMWCCDDCGTVHDRDVNAARNILRTGLSTLLEGACVPTSGIIRHSCQHKERPPSSGIFQ